MRKTWLAAIMAASALIPAAAIAQDDHDGHPHGEGHPQQHPAAPRPAGGGERPQPQRENAPQAPRQAQIQTRVQAQPQAQPQQRPERGERGDRPNFQGGRPDFRGQPPVQAQTRPAQTTPPVQQQQQRERGFDGRRGDGRPDVDNGQRGGRPDFNDGRSSRPEVDNRSRDGRPGFDPRRDNRGYANGNDGRWNGANRGDNRNWSRDWRRDNRYNYGAYRNQNRNAYHLPRYYAPSGWSYGYRRFSVGFRLSSILFGENYWIDNADYYRLPPAYGPYRWVRYYNDALLVDVRTGQVVDTVYDIFW